MVAVDPLASLRISDIYVTIGGREYLIPGRPAADWLEKIISGDLVSIIPGWFADDIDEDGKPTRKSEDYVLDALAEDTVTVKELNDATLEVISVAAGRPWWWAFQLINYASSNIHHWSRVSGNLVRAGVDATQISLAAWVDAVYVGFIAQFDTDEKYTAFKGQIDTPPTADLLDEEEESEAFMSMLGDL